MTINDIIIPEEYEDSHFACRVDNNTWYLIPNEVPTSDNERLFECWLINPNGTIATAQSYQMSKEELGF